MDSIECCYICLRGRKRLESCCSVCSAKAHSKCWRRLALSARLAHLKFWLTGRRGLNGKKIDSLALCPICRSAPNSFRNMLDLLPEQKPTRIVEELLKLSRLSNKQEFLTAKVQVDLSCITMVCGCIGTTADVIWYLFYPNTHWTLVVIPTLAFAYLIIVMYLLGSALAQRSLWIDSLPEMSKPTSVEYVEFGDS